MTGGEGGGRRGKEKKSERESEALFKGRRRSSRYTEAAYDPNARVRGVKEQKREEEREEGGGSNRCA